MANPPLCDRGKPIVLTAPLTEIIDHAGYFIQMSMASLPTRDRAFARLLVASTGDSAARPRRPRAVAHQAHRSGEKSVSEKGGE